MRVTLAIFGAASILLSGGAGVAFAQNATGAWVTEGAKSVVNIAPCGGNLCGKIVSLKEPNDENGKPKRDARNQDTSKRDRPLIGLSILNNMKQDKANRWAGNIYNPEDGKTYKAFMTLTGPGNLLVEGCVLGGLICKKQRWARQ